MCVFLFVYFQSILVYLLVYLVYFLVYYGYLFVYLLFFLLFYLLVYLFVYLFVYLLVCVLVNLLCFVVVVVVVVVAQKLGKVTSSSVISSTSKPRWRTASLRCVQRLNCRFFCSVKEVLAVGYRVGFLAIWAFILNCFICLLVYLL